MNNEEAQYKFRRMVAEVLKTLMDQEKPVEGPHGEKFDVTVEGEGEERDDGR